MEFVKSIFAGFGIIFVLQFSKYLLELFLTNENVNILTILQWIGVFILAVILGQLFNKGNYNV